MIDRAYAKRLSLAAAIAVGLISVVPACSSTTRDFGAGGAGGGGGMGPGAGGGGAGGAGGAGTGGGMLPGPPCTTGSEPTTLSSGHDYVSQIVADGSTVFWTDRIGEIGTLIDGAPAVIASGYPWALGIDVDATHVAWTVSDTNGSVVLAPKDGMQIMTVVVGQDRPWRVALDATHAYWVNSGPNFGSGGSVMRVARDGSGLTALAVDQVYLLDLAIDSSDVYFLSYGTGNGDDGAILRVNKAGGAMTLVIVGLKSPTHLAVDATRIYWTSNDGVWSMDKANGTPTALVAGSPAGDLVVDGDEVFFTEPSSGRVRRATIDGGPVITLVSGQAEPYGIAVDGTTLYWTTLGDTTTGVAGTVMKICR